MGTPLWVFSNVLCCSDHNPGEKTGGIGCHEELSLWSFSLVRAGIDYRLTYDGLIHDISVFSRKTR